MLSQRGRAHPQALRDRVFAYADGGMSVGGIAAALLVSISYVSKVLSRRGRTGETSARPQRCHVPRKLAGHLVVIEARVLSYPDHTLPELRAWLEREHAISASLGLLSETLRQMQLTRKKRPFTPPSKPARTSRPGERRGASNSPHLTRAS
jgi:transposase